MDMSGFAGLAAEERLEDFPESSETQSSGGIWGTGEGLLSVESTYATGADHTCAVMVNNSVYCWGNDDDGELGNTDSVTTDQNIPNLVDFSSYTGNNSYYSAPDGYFGNTVIEISAGHQITCARTDDGAVVCWGTGSQRVHGLSTNSDVPAPDSPVPLPGLATSITVGYRHACAILQNDQHNIDNGSVYCWGNNYYGQLGNGNSADGAHTPTLVSLPAGSEALQIATAYSHTCAIMSNDSVYCWGLNQYGQLGDDTRCQTGVFSNGCNGLQGKPTPTKLDLPDNIKPIQIATSYDSTCVVSSTFRLFCSGYLHHIYDGSGNSEMSPVELTGTFGPSGNVQQVTFSNTYESPGFCVLNKTHDVQCWGYNPSFRTGVSPSGWLYSYSEAESQNSAPNALNITSISIGGRHGCRSLSDNSLQCWGDNQVGEAGVGNFTSPIPSPSVVSGNHTLLMSNLDDDNDGIQDLFDSCPNGASGWTSSSLNDNDQDGCRDSDEDNDDDNDGFPDSSDLYPNDSRFFQNLTMADGWISGSRHELVGAGTFWAATGFSYGIFLNSTGTGGDHNYFSDSPVRSVSDSPWAISQNGSIINLDNLRDSSNYHDTWNSIMPSEAIAVAGAGSNNVCAIFADGTSWCQTSSNNNQPIQVSFSAPDNYPAKQVSVGSNGNYCFVLENSAVYCGSGTSNSSGWEKVSTAVSKTVISVHQYDNRMCVVYSDGSASCKGDNGYGQLGNGNLDSSNTLSPVYFPTGIQPQIQTMVMTQSSTCALFDNGTVYCWGDNREGQLGDGTVCIGNTFDNNCNGAGAKPIIYQPVILPPDKSAIAIWYSDVSYDEGYCVLLTNGGVWCWGNGNQAGPNLVLPNNGTGYYLNFEGHHLRPGNRDLDGDGVLNTYDNCANGTTGWTTNLSVDMDNDGCIDATEDIDDDGDGYSDSTEASCGTSPVNSSDIPLDTDGDGECNAFDNDDDNDGVLDVNDEMPTDPNGFVHLSLGDGFQSGQPLDNATLGNSGESVCVILSDNSLRCWGNNENGQIGDGTRGTTRYQPTNASIPAGKTPVSISTSSLYTSKTMCATMSDGTLYCWGSNSYGQIGIGTYCPYGSYVDGCNGNDGISTPTMVSLPNGRSATAVAVGESHACSILEDGSVWCWGSNQHGQLGVGNSSDTGNWRYLPNQVSLPSSVSAVAITLGRYHSCIVASDGVAYCWGMGDDGRLGHGSTNDENSPVAVASSENYVSISAGDYHTCAITQERSVQCWGVNWDGQLGDGSGTYGGRSIPADVSLPSGTQVTSIASGEKHNCVITQLMESYCWGEDGNNRLNTEYECTNDFTNGCYNNDRHIPATSILPAGRNAIAVVAGDEWTCLLLDNGGVYCFGNNGKGELGNGSTNGQGPNYVPMPTEISPKSNDRDLDGDNVFNNEDDCMEGETGWYSNSTSDFDGDGCRDATEDLDDDNDFLNDTDEATIGTNSTNPDTDGDGYLDGLDAFPLDASEWSDVDSDGIGDNADTDDDNDLWSDTDEVACNTDPLNGTDTPVDTDGDSQCNYLDSDDDGDGVSDDMDSFPLDPAATTDTDGDGMPDSLNGNSTTNLTEDDDDDNDLWSDIDETACGTNPLSNASVPQDSDNDTVCDPLDAFPNDSTEWSDSDSDGVGDNSDVFPNDSNETSDNDGDGLGDNADTDDDNDNWSDSDEVACLTDPLDNSSIPGDIDADGICDALELDLDNDGWTNANESYCGTDWTDVNSVPLDTDGDMICDIMDYDDDGDLVLDVDDAFPLDGTEWLDSDGDGVGNNADPDDDNDGCMDLVDDLPLDPTECYDTDNDGIGNNADDDDDGDNLSDSEDPFPQDGSATVDTDGDGYPDFLNGNSTTGLIADWDDDNDGWNDTDDAFPLDATEWLDTDMDGQGNNADLNDDGDPCLDVDDAFPLDASECYDTDGDGVGNNADPDDDNDGWLDTITATLP